MIILDHNMIEVSHVADEAMRWLFTEVWRMVQRRQEQLPAKAKPLHQAFISVIKPISKPLKADRGGTYLKREENNQ